MGDLEGLFVGDLDELFVGGVDGFVGDVGGGGFVGGAVVGGREEAPHDGIQIDLSLHQAGPTPQNPYSLLHWDESSHILPLQFVEGSLVGCVVGRIVGVGGGFVGGGDVGGGFVGGGFVGGGAARPSLKVLVIDVFWTQ